MDFLMALLLIWSSAAPTGLHALRVSNTGWSRATFCKPRGEATNWECYEYWEYRGLVLGKACPLSTVTCKAYQVIFFKLVGRLQFQLPVRTFLKFRFSLLKSQVYIFYRGILQLFRNGGRFICLKIFLCCIKSQKQRCFCKLAKR